MNPSVPQELTLRSCGLPGKLTLAVFLLGQLASIRRYAVNTDALGLVAAPVVGVGTGEYDLVNGWSLASTSWARFAFEGWNVYTHTNVA